MWGFFGLTYAITTPVEALLGREKAGTYLICLLLVAPLGFASQRRWPRDVMYWGLPAVAANVFVRDSSWLPVVIVAGVAFGFVSGAALAEGIRLRVRGKRLVLHR